MPKGCLDRDGDVLPAGAIDRLGTVRLRHAKDVYAVAFSPSGDVLATSGDYGSICLWRMPDGKLLRKLQIGDNWDWIDYLTFSRDGKVLACARSQCGRINFWDPASGKLLRQMDLRSTGRITSFALAPDGKTVTAGFDDLVLGCWDAQSGKQIRQYAKTMLSTSLAYSADGKVLMSGDGDRNMRVWEAGQLRRLGGHPDPGNRYERCFIALSPDGKTFAHAIGAHLEIRDAKTGVRLHKLPGHECEILALAFSADGKMLASADCFFEEAGRPSIRWWDVRTGQLLHAIAGHKAYLPAVAFSPDGKILAAGGNNNTTKLWDTASGNALHPCQEHCSIPRTLAYSPDGRLLASAGDDGVILLWDLHAKSPPRRLRDCRTGVSSLAFAPDGRLLAVAGRDGRIRLWSPASAAVVRQWTAHAKTVSAILFAPDGRTLFSGGDSGGEGEPIMQWDVASGKEVRRLKGHLSWVCYLAWSIPGEVLFSESVDYTIRSWDARTGREIRCYRRRSDYWESLAVSPDGRRLVAQCHEDPMEVWDLSAKNKPSHMTGLHGVNRLLFSPDGRTLVLGNTHTGELMLWEMLAEKPRGELSGHLGAISCLAFSPNGKHLATASDDTSILIWDMRRSPTEDASAPLQDGELATLWRRLGERDARLAYRAVLRLSAHPAETLPFARQHLAASAPIDPPHIRRRIDELDDERFAVRERARRELEQVVENAEPLLRQALTEKPPLEVRLRIENVLASQPPLCADNAPADRLRELRAVEVLERIGSAEAQRLLAVLAAGAPTARLTREAEAARKHLASTSRKH
jgi:WD40 repeat protein